MDLKALIAKMDKIESKQILNEAITMKDVQAAVGQEKDEQKRAAILNDLAWKENLPGLYDPVSGYYIRKQSPNPDTNQVSIAATAREADTQALAKLGLVPGTAKTSALGGLVGTGKFGLDKDSQAANDKASRDVKQQSANVQGKQSSDAFIAPKLKRLNDLVAKISGGTKESISFNGSIARTLVESFSYQLYEKATLGTGDPVYNPATGVTAGRYQSEVAEIRELMAELADIDDPAVIQALGSAQKALDKLATPAGQKVDPDQADRDDADLGAAMRANAAGVGGQAASPSVAQSPEDHKKMLDRVKSGTAPSGTQVQTDDNGNHMITTPDGKTIVVGPDGKTLPNGGKETPGKTANEPGKQKPGQKIGYANPGTRAYQHWLNSKGVKVGIDGKYGPETQEAGKQLPKEYQPGGDRAASDEYMAMLGVGTAYNVIPTPGKENDYVRLNSPRYLETMKKYGYDPKTGNPIGGQAGGQASPAAGGQGSKPPGGITPGQNARDDLLARQGKPEKVSPMPDPNRRTGTIAQRDEWMAKYGKTHNMDGTPKSTGQAASPSAAGGGSSKIPSSADKTQPYWVDGTRYEWKQRRSGGMWEVTATPQDKLQWNSTRGRSMNKYTGPDDGFDTWMTAQRQSKQQAASPTAGAPKSSTSSSELRIAGAPVVPGQPLSQVQMSVMASGMKMGNTYPPEVMAQYNKQKGASPTKESITQSEDDDILAMIRAIR